MIVIATCGKLGPLSWGNTASMCATSRMHVVDSSGVRLRCESYVFNDNKACPRGTKNMSARSGA